MIKLEQLPKISDAEYEIMKIIWKYKKITAVEVIEKVDAKLDWNDKTIKTMLNRLLKKKVIDYERQGKHYIYFPIVKQDEYRVVETKSFVKKIFDGSLNTLVASFLKEETLSREEIDELKRMLDEKEDDKI